MLPVENLTPAARFLRDAVQGMADNQQIILNSQQASRDLMGVMIQDNLNLKGEASSLRERMLEMERELAELRRRQADYRERMETRVHVLEDAVARLMAGQVQAVPPPPAARSSMPYPYQPPPPTATAAPGRAARLLVAADRRVSTRYARCSRRFREPAAPQTSGSRIR